MRIRVKICGITDDSGLEAAARFGADAVGFVLSESPRRVTVDRARRLCATLPPRVRTVAVFRRAVGREIESLLPVWRPHLVQSEPPDGGAGWPAGRYCRLPVIRGGPDAIEEARRIAGAASILLEAVEDVSGGLSPSWSRAAGIARGARLVLAGGLHPGNVIEAILRVRPFGVDVSRGVESGPGRKEPERIEAFMAAVREAEVRLGRRRKPALPERTIERAGGPGRGLDPGTLPEKEEP